MEVAVFIYGLKDPRTDVIRYVGQTKQPWPRSRDHAINFTVNPTSPKTLWAKELSELKLEPKMKILEFTTSGKAGYREAVQIYENKGPFLLNKTQGNILQREYDKGYGELLKGEMVSSEQLANKFGINNELMISILIRHMLNFFTEYESKTLWVSDYQLGFSSAKIAENLRGNKYKYPNFF